MARRRRSRAHDDRDSGRREQASSHDPETPNAGYREVLSNQTFRVLFLARFAGIAAETFRTVAVSVIVFEITRSPLLAAITYGVAFLPQLIGATLLGPLADNLWPRRSIVFGYLLQALVTLVVTFAAGPVALKLAALASLALAAPIFGGASNKLIAQELVGDAYVLGRSLSSMATAFSQIVGLALSGVALTILGSTGALVLCSLLQLACAAGVRLRLRDFPSSPPDSRSSLIKSGLANSRALMSTPRLRLLFLMQWLPLGIFSGAESLVIPRASAGGDWSGSPGYLLAAIPIGMFMGQAILGRLLSPPRRTALVLPLMVLLGLPLISFGFDANAPVLWCSLLVAGFGFAYSLGLQRPFADALDGPTRGQGFAFLGAGLMTWQGVGPMIAGGIAETVGAGWTMTILGITITVLAVVLWVLRLWPLSEHGHDVQESRDAEE